MSSLKEALSHLYLTEPQAIALIDNLFLAGVFEPQPLWNGVHLMGGMFGKPHNVTPETLFRHIYQVMKSGGAYGSRVTDFRPIHVMDNLFADSAIADVEDAEDLLVYWSQSNYGRNANQERYEIPENELLRSNQERYQMNARVLGIINTITADRRRYDETWVLGSVRQGMLERVEMLEKSFISGNDPGRIRILAGNWELYAEISGKYNPVTGNHEGGGEYLVELAGRHDIAVDSEMPFVTHAEGREDIYGRIAGRTYLNYAVGERRRLTESLMARDMVTQFMRRHGLDIIVSQTEPEEASIRPDTLMTVENEARRLVMQLAGVGRRLTDNHQRLHIQLVSGQPSVMRQAVLTQRTIDQMLIKEGLVNVSARVHGIGRHAYNIRVEILQSEEAALLSEYYLTMSYGKARKRPAANLMFRTRNNDASKVAPVLLQ